MDTKILPLSYKIYLRSPSQNVPLLRPFIRSPIKFKKQNSGKISQILESNELRERPAHSFGYIKLPSPPIRSSGASTVRSKLVRGTRFGGQNWSEGPVLVAKFGPRDQFWLLNLVRRAIFSAVSTKRCPYGKDGVPHPSICMYVSL